MPIAVCGVRSCWCQNPSRESLKALPEVVTRQRRQWSHDDHGVQPPDTRAARAQPKPALPRRPTRFGGVHDMVQRPRERYRISVSDRGRPGGRRACRVRRPRERLRDSSEIRSGKFLFSGLRSPDNAFTTRIFVPETIHLDAARCRLDVRALFSSRGEHAVQKAVRAPRCRQVHRDRQGHRADVKVR